jgi:hypothetical protein
LRKKRKKINYTRKNMFKKKKEEYQLHYHFHVQSPNLRCLVVPETKQAC